MGNSVSYRNKGCVFFVILLISSVAFAAEVLDVRDDLHILNCPPHPGLDQSISTGIIRSLTTTLELSHIFRNVQWSLAFKYSSIHLLPHGVRAPPA